jgi:ubiquinone/menaquinone biosynthesis C-methylase UbiE
MSLSNLTQKKQSVSEFIDHIAPKRDSWIRLNRYYYNDLLKLFRYSVPEKSSVIEIGCGTGFILNQLEPERGVGIDISPEMIRIAQEKYPHHEFKVMDAENISLNESFDYIIISDTLGYFEDIQKSFSELKKICSSSTRIIITYHNYLWTPFTTLAEWLHLKMPRKKLNWLNKQDICNLLQIENFEVIKTGKRFLFPFYLPVISWIFNRILVQLPVIRSLSLTGYIIARKIEHLSESGMSVSVIVPARNESGNIENALLRMPKMGKHTEVIFVEGHSTDNTPDEIKRVCNKYKDQWDVKFVVQEGKGKGDAVRKGFDVAQGDILMILDADLTVPPEQLPKFYDAIVSGKGEFINGTRLVYPMEKEAMRFLNMIGNNFFSVMFSWLLEQRLKDTLCGTKVLLKKNYTRIRENRHYFGEFDPFGDFDLLFGASKLNLKIIEIPIRYHAREYGETNISRFKHGWLLIKMTLFALYKMKI